MTICRPTSINLIPLYARLSQSIEMRVYLKSVSFGCQVFCGLFSDMALLSG